MRGLIAMLPVAAGVLVAVALAAAVPAAAAPEAASDSASDWTLVWSDEFDGTALDRRKWSLADDCWGGGNDERQCYTHRRANAVVRDGLLQIVARRERFSGPAYAQGVKPPPGAEKAEATRDFTSARLSTHGKAAWTYGRIEMRARLPQGQGVWPAFWMLPEDYAYGPWAASGEIDILEAVNLGTACKPCATGREDTILGTLHFGGPAPANRHKGTEVHAPAVLDGFHTYGVEWSAQRIVWTLDGAVYATRTPDEWGTSATSVPGAPFDRPFHLILNLAVGGHLAEERGLGGVSARDFPKRYEIDWVRVWQHGASPARHGK